MGQRPVPWGFWATMGFSCIIGIVYIFIQMLVFAGFAVVAGLRRPDFDIQQFAQGLEADGFFLSIAICATAPFTVGLTMLFARIRRTITIKQYLRLGRLGWKELCKWCLIVFLFVGCFDTLTFLLGRPIVPEFMADTYKTAHFTLLLWLAFVIIAPVMEEIFFRGFLFTGLESSRLGPAGAIIIASLIWSVMHIQYDIYGRVNLFLGGLLLGFARAKSNSIYPPMVMHILQNTIATIETIIYLRMTSAC